MPSAHSMPSPDQGEPPKTLLFNFSSLLGGTVFAKALGLLNVILLTRAISVESFGLYALAFNIWAFLNHMVDLGGFHIANRNLVETQDPPRETYESIIYLRLFGCLLFLPLLFLAGPLLNISPSFNLIIAIGILAGFETFYDLYFSVTMQLDKRAKARVSASLCNTLVIALALAVNLSLQTIILLIMLNPALKLIFDWYFSKNPFAWRLSKPNFAKIKSIVVDGWPVWLSNLQYTILTRIDTLLLLVLLPAAMGQYELGIYSAAFRFSEVMGLLITSLIPVLLPLLVKASKTDRHIQWLATTCVKTILSLLVVGSLILFWYAPLITKLIGAKYEAASACLQILIASQAFAAFNAVCYNLLLVYNAQRKSWVIISNVLLTLANIGLNIILIPQLKANGAAWSTVLTEMIASVIMLISISCFTKIRLIPVLAIVLVFTAVSNAWVFFNILGPDSQNNHYLLAWLSPVLFLGLMLSTKVLNVSDLKKLANEKLGKTQVQ
ncbi:MAG: oligosaccharide flippase family protein [Cyanobacteria bacterium P01_H01_bin.74]